MDGQMQQAADGITPFTRLILELRGVCFVIERETLMSLPESILLCLFPNGLVLSDGVGDMSSTGEGAVDEQVHYVDFDATCLQYVLTFFRRAQEYFYGTETQPGIYWGMGLSPSYMELADASNAYGQPFHMPLFHKQAVIVLREELEYFVIPPKNMYSAPVRVSGAAPNAPPGANMAFVALKDACGDVLLQRRHIFTALQRNINKENNVAEQHLIDMLCMSGFDKDDLWGYRAREPGRCGITSTALVLLKTGVTHPAELPDRQQPDRPLQRPIGVERAGVDAAAGVEPVPKNLSEEQLGDWVDDGQGGSLRVNQQQLATTQKLLLFWRKPARKCWWDGIDIILPSTDAVRTDPTAVSPTVLTAMTPQERALLDGGKGQLLRVWVRRVWTLEVSLI
ncbi:hypothetical protein MSPP1_003262 [Malassezia sp. CBS 17886]|nr:hypothetical protein MSPP1_003262 [Malassezia sp. CBS 17886]